MLILELKSNEEEVFREQVFAIAKATILEITNCYSEYLDSERKLKLVKSFAKYTNELIRGLEDDTLDLIISVINLDTLKRIKALEDNLTPHELYNDIIYTDNIFVEGFKVITRVVEALEVLYPRETEDQASYKLNKLGQYFRRVDLILDKMRNTLDYKFFYVDINSEEFLYMKYIACATSTSLKFLIDKSFGSLTCGNKDTELMRTTIDKYIAKLEIAEGQHRAEAEECTQSFF